MDISKRQLRKARILAMQVIYSTERNEVDNWEGVFEAALMMPETSVASHEAVKFAKSIVASYYDLAEHIDSIISKHIQNWVIGRLGAIDRSILRIAIAELISIKTPLKVVISEAVDIAKVFGTDESSKFINGVLDATKQDIDYTE